MPCGDKCFGFECCSNDRGCQKVNYYSLMYSSDIILKVLCANMFNYFISIFYGFYKNLAISALGA